MKKFYPFCVLLSVMGICGLLSSCSSSDGGDTPPPGIPENSFAYGDAQSKIGSVVYTVDQQKVYTFYFSPTQGLVDLEAMLLADDYMKIVTTTPTGAIDLLSDRNSLIYKNVNISSAAGDNVERATLSLQLTSLTTAKMSLDAAMKSGETLRAEYNGLCLRQDDQQGDNYDVTLTKQIFGYYMGPDKGNAGTNGYYIALTDAEFQVQGTQFALTTNGYALVLNFYGNPGETWNDMPTGAFTDSGRFEDHTFDSVYSGVLFQDDSGLKPYTLVDPVRIERDAEDQVKITATFLDQDYQEQTLIYQGSLKLGNATLGVYLPQLDRDVVIEGVYAQGVYNGDVMENGTGLTEITIYDEKGDNNEPNGYAMKIALFAEKFVNPERERRLIPGTYKASKAYTQGTWMPTVEMSFMDMIIPMGTYAAYDDGTQVGQFAYASEGDIVIRQGNSKTHYTIEFDLKSISGYSIRGSFTGEVYLENQSNDNDNDGTSNLKDDYELNFNYLERLGRHRADCYPQSEMWVRTLGVMPVSEELWAYSDGRQYGLQHIVIGRESYEYTDEYPEERGVGKLVEGDILGIDLLTELGKEDRITPGVYPITAERWPYYFYPGVCVRGYNCYYGTSMIFKTSAIGNGYPKGYYDPTYVVQGGWINTPVIDKFASIYAGTVTVEKAEGGENWYTISVDGRDVLKHRITGSWTGPIYLGGTDTPVVQAGSTVQTTAKQHTPSFREMKPHLMEQQNNFPKLRSLK